MKPYIIEKSKRQPYSALIIGTTAESPYVFFQELELDLKNSNIKGKLLFDFLLHNGNSSNRFLEIDFEDHLDLKRAHGIKLDRENYFRRQTSEILSKLPEVIRNSILNMYQRELVMHEVSL